MQLSATDTKQNRSQQNRSGRQHVLIIGASIARLLTARILSDYFELVTAVERDQLPTNAQAHKGIPQGRHIDLLMGKGADIIHACLDEHLSSHAGNMAGFPHHFQKALASVVDVPWLFATSEDFRYPATEGKRPFGIRMLQGYTQRVSRLTATNPFVTQSFYEVLNMLKPPTALFHPRILLPALLARQ